MRPTSLPLHPWQKISADLFQAKQQHFLVVMNYYSCYLEIAYLPDISSATMIGKMKNMFTRWCVPEEIVFDNGTQFTSAAFQSFAEKYNFVCSFTSPHFPQANGQAESAVKIAKRIVEQQQDPFLGLMAYRSTPISATDVSPAQLMMGRQMRTNLPVLLLQIMIRVTRLCVYPTNQLNMTRSRKRQSLMLQLSSRLFLLS